jgi:RNA polymerase sigma-B factor
MSVALGVSMIEPVSMPDAERAERSAELLARMSETDDTAERDALRAEVVVLNMRVAKAIARRYRRRGLPEDDLEQVAYVGLVNAVNRFDPSHGRDFLSFAVPTIAGEVKRYFRDFGWVVRPPRRMQELQSRISDAARSLSQSLGRSPKPSEIAAELGLDPEEVIEVLSIDGAFAPVSLDVPVGQDDSATLGDLIPGEELGYGDAEARAILGPAVRALPDRDRRILELRFFAGWTQEQIAQDIGVTQIQVSRRLARIFTSLRARLA